MAAKIIAAKPVADLSLDSSRYPTQQRLVAAIRKGEEQAIRELFVLYAPLLRDQARLMSVPADERDHLVETLLDDIVIHLVDVGVPPRELTSYIVNSFRHRVRTRHRDEARGRVKTDRAYTESGGSDECIVAECHSEYALRASQPPDVDGAIPLRSAIRKLAERSVSDLSDEELILMIGVGRRIPLRDLAEQLGISHDAARRRVSRLRQRFVRLAIEYVATLEASEKREIERFFRRAHISLDVSPADSDINQRNATCGPAPQRE